MHELNALVGADSTALSPAARLSRARQALEAVADMAVRRQASAIHGIELSLLIVHRHVAHHVQGEGAAGSEGLGAPPVAPKDKTAYGQALISALRLPLARLSQLDKGALRDADIFVSSLSDAIFRI